MDLLPTVTPKNRFHPLLHRSIDLAAHKQVLTKVKRTHFKAK